MTLYQKFTKLKIDHAAIGIEQGESHSTYFCTPKGAKIIGWAGVDGIHYCTIRGLGEVVFAVSPMNLPGDYVHPIARNFEDLLSLLLSCGSMAAIEQAHMWEKTQFEAYVEENQPSDEQTTIMNVIKEKFIIMPMADPFSYIKKLQEDFDYSQIKYTPDYYDIDMNPFAQEQVAEWKVTYGGGFYRNRGRAAKEIPVRKTFFWGDERWYIPSIYICGKGLIIDFCIDGNPDILRDFIEKWDLFNHNNNHYSKEWQEQMQNEHPLNIEFEPSVTLNGKQMRFDCGVAISWIPESCLNEEFNNDMEAKHVMEHYGLDPSRGWSIQRYSFLWTSKRAPIIKSLKLFMRRRPVNVPGPHFISPSVGDTIKFTHPTSLMEHTLTIHEYEQQQMEERHFHNEDMVYPTHYTAMTYTVCPDIPGSGFILRDYDDGDRPRMKNQNDGSPVSVAIGIIGGANAPTIIVQPNGEASRTHVACSSLYYDTKSNIEWYMTFRVKMIDDIDVTLIEPKLKG